MTPGFSERTFEFCFNAEYCHLNAALLASHPHIPSQNAEKDLGYDVEFQIKQGGFVKSVFLQHKVPCYAAARAGRNAKFFDHHAGPYYRFPIDNDQHQTLIDLSTTKGDAFYCSPCFVGSKALENHWRAQTIGMNSVLLDPIQVGVAGPGHHNITYGPNGEKPALHSDTRDFSVAYYADKKRMPPLKARVIDETYIREMDEELTHRASNRAGIGPVSLDIKGRKPLERIQILLARVYQVSWLLLRE